MENYQLDKNGRVVIRIVERPPVVIDMSKNDLRAMVRYTPSYLNTKDATTLFKALRTYNVDGLNDGGNMYGKEWLSERKTIQIGDAGVRVYKYTGSSATKVISWDKYPAIKRLRDKIYADTGYYFNFCLYNSYTPDAKLGWHGDGQKDMVEGEPVASISVGDKRRFRFRHTDTHEIAWDDYLESGSLLIMEMDTQKLLEHALWDIIKADEQYVIEGFRVNLTFRVMKLCAKVTK